MSILFGNGELYAKFFDLLDYGSRYIAIGDDVVDIFHVCNFTETSSAEFRTIGKDDSFLCRFHHYAVERSFLYVGGGDAKFEVDTIDAKEKFAASKVCEELLGIVADNREATVTK